MNFELRDPNIIMKLSRLGSFHQSRLSFLRSFLNEFKDWNYKRDLFDLDENGFGVAVYSFQKKNRVISTVVDSLIKEKTIQPIYYPSINNKNLKNFENKFFKEFNEFPNYLSLLSYDLVGLVYYLSFKNDFSNMNSLLKKKNSFRGKIGIFDIENNKINHRLNFYKTGNEDIKEIF